MIKLFSAVNYMHKNQIAHRDLKPENILYTDNDEELKIIDFGLSNKYQENYSLKTIVGTPQYISPEIISGVEYTDKCDIWSLGIIMYCLLCGYPPFLGDTNQ